MECAQSERNIVVDILTAQLSCERKSKRKDGDQGDGDEGVYDAFTSESNFGRLATRLKVLLIVLYFSQFRKVSSGFLPAVLAITISQFHCQ